MTQPFVTVGSPVGVAYRYGIFSAAALIDSSDQREFHAGVQWEPNLVDAPASATSAPASDPDRPDKVLPAGPALVQAGPPIRLYTGVETSTVGRDDHLEQARARLGLIEQQSLEHYAWTGDAGNRPRLADPATPVLADGPQRLAAGIGVLEEWISDQTGVLGAIWAPRTVAADCMQQSLVRPESQRLVAPLGNPTIFAHTSGVGPQGPPPAGTAWLYGTGPVIVRRSGIVGPRLDQALDAGAGAAFAMVERFYLVGWSVAAAVQVRIP